MRQQMLEGTWAFEGATSGFESRRGLSEVMWPSGTSVCSATVMVKVNMYGHHLTKRNKVPFYCLLRNSLVYILAAFYTPPV